MCRRTDGQYLTTGGGGISNAFVQMPDRHGLLYLYSSREAPCLQTTGAKQNVASCQSYLTLFAFISIVVPVAA